jgi:hypothetical protein
MHNRQDNLLNVVECLVDTYLLLFAVISCALGLYNFSLLLAVSHSVS